MLQYLPSDDQIELFAIPYREFTCNTCNEVFNTGDSLNCHLRVHMETTTYMCKYCGNCKRDHACGKQYKCGTCHKIFPRIGNLRNHVASKHRSERPFKCDICGNTFKLKQQLKIHMDYHLGIVFKCELCGVAYRRKHNLQRHLRSKH